MAQYTKSQLVSASNATYFTNTSGGISASAVRDLNDSWISSSALLSGSNTFIGNQIISGNLDLSGTITASLQTGYLYVGNGSGRTQAVATSSIITNIATGSFATTGSNTFTGNQTINGTGTAATVLQVNKTIGNYNPDIQVGNWGGGQGFSLSQFDDGTAFTSAGMFMAGISGAFQDMYVNQGNYDSFHIELGANSAGGLNSGVWFSDFDGANYSQFMNVGTNAGNIRLLRNTQITGSLNISGSLTASLANGFTYVGDSNNRTKLVATSSFGSSINTGSFATTGSNTFYGDQSITGSLSANIPTAKQFRINWAGAGSSASMYTDESSGPNQTLNLTSASLYLNRGGLYMTSGSFTSQIGDMQFNASPSASFTVRTTYGGNAILRANTDYTDPNRNYSYFQASPDGQISIVGKGDGVIITGSLGTTIQGLKYPSTDGTAGQVLTTDGSKNLTFTTVAASINTGSFATTGSNTFTGNQTIMPASGTAITISGSTGFGYGIRLQGQQGISLEGSGGPRIIFPNASWMNGNEGDDFQFTGDTNNPLTRGLDFFLYGTGSRQMQFRNNSGNSANILFQTTTGTATDSIKFSSVSGGISFGAGQGIAITGSTVQMQGFTYPTTDGTSGQVLTTNGSKVLTFTTITGSGGSTDTGSLLVTASFNTTTRNITFTKGDNTTFNLGGFAITGSNTFRGDQTISYSGNNNFYISSSTGGQSNIYLQSPVGNNLQAYAQLNIGNNGANGGSGSLVIVATKNTIQLAADSGVAIGPTAGNGNAIATGAIRLLAQSGSLVLTNNSYTNTSASLSHLSSSDNTILANFIFKPNANTGTTIISGSSNIFTNPNTPTTGYIRYVGGSNNLYLNSSNGINSQITASATSVSGVRPVMNNNIFQGSGDFIINQAVNPGAISTYSNNIFASINTTTINALAYTGSSFTFSDNILKGAAITINPASASIAEIAAGISGSAGNGFQIDRNTILGTGGMNIVYGPKVITGFGSVISNIVNAGSITITNISSSTTVSAASNILNGPLTYTNAGAAGLGLHNAAGAANANYGGAALTANASAIGFTSNISTGNPTITNNSWTGSIGSGSLAMNRCIFVGQQHTVTVSGSQDAATLGTISFSDNAILGKANTIFSNQTGAGAYNGFNGNVVGGANLIITGSNNFNAQEGGSGFFGRYNANDGRRNKTGENVLVVGTGTSTARKTGFLIDSGSNSYFEGTLNVSGSTAMNGNQDITGSLLVSSFTTLASVSSSLNFADDTAAAAGGVPLGGLYRNGNFVMIRLT